MVEVVVMIQKVLITALAKKLVSLKQGKDVRPPKPIWMKIYKKVKKQYPGYSDKRRKKITAGIWHKMPINIKMKLIVKLMRKLMRGVAK